MFAIGTHMTSFIFKKTHIHTGLESIRPIEETPVLLHADTVVDADADDTHVGRYLRWDE